MRICTRVEEKESKDAEMQFFDPMVIPCGARRDFLEKFKVPVDATITFQCTLMKMLTVQKFNCLVTNDTNRTYFGCPGWKALANAYKMEAGERATFYLDYDRDEIMVYYKLAGSDDGSLTPDYDPDFVR
uniref:TF-B3 domain-containing protein n=1 Tax=Aegilops tauschii TaxID=37682 RepID=M8B3B4_AEGTA